MLLVVALIRLVCMCGGVFLLILTETKYGIEPHEFLKRWNAETRNFYKWYAKIRGFYPNFSCF